MRPHLDRLVWAGRPGVAAIGVAQEFQRMFTGTTYHADPDGGGIPRFVIARPSLVDGRRAPALRFVDQQHRRYQAVHGGGADRRLVAWSGADERAVVVEQGYTGTPVPGTDG